MEELYHIYTTRGQGWLNTSGTAGTQMEEAKEFTKTAAMAHCARVNTPGEAPIMIPVSANDLRGAGIRK